MKNEEELENPGLTFVNSIVNIDAEEPIEWSGIATPLVRRAFPQLLSTKLVGVAPIPVKKNKQPFSLNPGKNYKRKNKR